LHPVESTEVITARGHENISATHETTLEVTKQALLSRRGTCIIAVEADKAIDDLSLEFKKNLRRDHARIVIRVEAGELAETITACGDPRLILVHPTDIVIRKGDYICNRTLAVHADKSACELSKELVKRLQNSRQIVRISLTVRV
jgi:hypothetical protein